MKRNTRLKPFALGMLMIALLAAVLVVFLRGQAGASDEAPVVTVTRGSVHIQTS